MTAPAASIQIYNTESGRKERFEPDGPQVRMYVCGLTPKGEPHLGHARLFVVNDAVRRYLTYRGLRVKYVQNFTDIDDKIIAAGKREGIPPSLAAQRYTQTYFRDMGRLGVEPADVYTYVTDFIPRIIEMTQALIERGHAYEIEGDVYFSVPSFPDYGKLSGRDAEAMLAGARVEVDERKRDVRDFALWKAAKPGEPSWPSPWGPGRPGWHIECSAMAMAELGPTIDIHGGGSDLIFPHHENEIAQSESFSGVKPFVRYWLHTGMLSIADEKMAHSLGNYVTIRSVLEGDDVPGPALRTYLLSQLYRANLVFADEPLRASVKRWRRWAETRATLARLLDWARQRVSGTAETTAGPAETRLRAALENAKTGFVAAMDDDFNTSLALAIVDDLAHRINDYADGLGNQEPTGGIVAALSEAQATLDELLGALGIALVDTEAPGPRVTDEQVAAIERLVQERTAARTARDWAEADRIRSELAERFNVVIKDTPQGPAWSVREPTRA